MIAPAKPSLIRYHLASFFIVAIWGTTFVSTKTLLNEGLSSADVIFYRFALAYLILFVFFRKSLWAHSFKDECLLILAGVFGGSFYFITENEALHYTLTTNVALLVSTAPLFTALLVAFYTKERLGSRFIPASILALIGVALIVFNGHFVLKLSPIGDILCLLAALSWACYCLVLQNLSQRYDAWMITRKVFFYGMVTLLPYFIFKPLCIDTAILFKPIVWMNLSFLALIASLLCYVLWNHCLIHLGSIRVSYYIYLIPLFTALCASIVLEEHLSAMGVLGMGIVILGLIWSQQGFVFKKKTFQKLK